MNLRPLRHLDVGSRVVIVVTFVLFGLAVFLKGLTHELLLEVAVFLVSVKLILMTFKNGAHAEAFLQKLDEIQAAIERIEKAGPRQESGNRLR